MGPFPIAAFRLVRQWRWRHGSLRRHLQVIVLAVCMLVPAGVGGAQPVPPLAPRDRIAVLIERLEQLAGIADRAAILALGGTDAYGLDELAGALTAPKPTRVVVRERDRRGFGPRGQRLLLEIFAQRDSEGWLGTWQVDVHPGATEADAWNIVGATRFSHIGGLYRLSLNAAKEYDVEKLTIRAPDLEIEMPSGSAFVAETEEGPTAVVLIGRGIMRFSPSDPAERTQVRIFSGEDALAAEFTAAFIRIRPTDFETMFDAASLRARTPAPGSMRQALEVFEEYVGKTLQVDLSDLTRDRWSLTPPSGNVIAEVRTRRWGSLTYARSGNDAEDITLFDRKRRHNISSYASVEKLAQRGRFYSEDELAEYDVLTYDVDVDITPDRELIEGNARIKLKIQTGASMALTFKLAETLVVQGVYAPEFGRLLHLRVVGQNSLIVNLPALVTRGTEMWIEVIYRGRLPAQSFDREAIVVGQESQDSSMPLEPRYLYSNRSYWYPQSTVTDYATAKLRVTVPYNYDVVASGDPAGPPAPPPGVAGQKGRKMFVFDAARPVRYLACVISRFNPVNSMRLKIADDRDAPSATSASAAAEAGSPPDMTLFVQATPRQVSRARATIEDAASIIRFYGSIVGNAPFPTFTLAVSEFERPGGHSPPYFAILNQVPITSTVVWRNDPVSFENFPAFFLAHELAHQWWGHAVGWKNYHEQWISEGFSQYFAALYAEKSRPVNTLGGLLRQMRQTAIKFSGEGPVYLGYRLGHIRGEDQVFRAIVYNKGAMVLHMLRRLVGDETFFAGVRDFYTAWAFRKAGTDDFRKAMEAASGLDLRRYFETWVYGTRIPRIAFSYKVSGESAELRFEQVEDPVDVPLTVTFTYVSGETEDVVVALRDALTERLVALKGPVRTIAVNADNGALVEINK